MRLKLLAIFLGLFSGAAAQTPLDAAIALYQGKQYPAASESLEKIVAAEPGNAAANYYLGMTLSRRGDDKALPEAVRWLEKAAKLAPENATYLADYAGQTLLLAQQTHSLTAAIRGRDAMEKALQMDPGTLEARVGLYRFYNEAPWPLGDKKKARAQLDEIARRDPDRAQRLAKSPPQLKP